VNALVAPTDAKVSTISSSNRFTFTLVASAYRIRLKRQGATDSSVSNEPTMTLDKVKCIAKAHTTGPGWRLPQRCAKGLGEVFIVGVAAAIANAIHQDTGRRRRYLPIRIEHLLNHRRCRSHARSMRIAWR
jgi:hypothetical protein